MITTFGKGTILKGSDCEIVIPISTCCQHIDIDTVQDFSVAFYTEAGGQAVMKYKDDFEFEGDMGLVHFQWQELDQLADGVIRYTIHYDDKTAERTTSYMLKTPMAYTPMDFVSRDEVEGVVSAATSGLATEEYVDEAVENLPSSSAMTEAINQAVSGLASEEYVDEAIARVPAGPQGAMGAQGPQGARGETGDETYYVDVSTLTPEQMAQVRGPQGEIGAQGSRGTRGPQGDTGMTGPQGSAGSGNVSSATINTIWTGTQAQYDALPSYDDDTLYFIDQD